VVAFKIKGSVESLLERLVPVAAPMTGVTRVGLVDSTTATVPVLAATPVPPLATGSVPVTPVVNGNPAQLVSVPEAGMPSAGVTKVGEVALTGAPDPVAVVHTGAAPAPPPTKI